MSRTALDVAPRVDCGTRGMPAEHGGARVAGRLPPSPEPHRRRVGAPPRGPRRPPRQHSARTPPARRRHPRDAPTAPCRHRAGGTRTSRPRCGPQARFTQVRGVTAPIGVTGRRPPRSGGDGVDGAPARAGRGVAPAPRARAEMPCDAGGFVRDTRTDLSPGRSGAGPRSARTAHFAPRRHGRIQGRSVFTPETRRSRGHPLAGSADRIFPPDRRIGDEIVYSRDSGDCVKGQ